jgi:NRAMP (natural resistance-associated macrophage protein)-like metal ion transporter
MERRRDQEVRDASPSAAARESSLDDAQSARSSEKRRWWSVLGPGFITGAADDDPSGIGTYSQVGAQFGYTLCWTMLLSFPLMLATQEISARVGRATGHGLAGVLRRHSPAWLVYGLVALFVVANTINLAADLAAMGEVVAMQIGGPRILYVALFGLGCTALQLAVGYGAYVKVLKWLSLSLLAYAGTAFAGHVSWGEVLHSSLVPRVQFSSDFITAIVAVVGTTISPNLFFWQSSEEAEDQRDAPKAKPLRRAPEQAPAELRRIRLDTTVGMAVSNLISWSIIVTAGADLHVKGVTRIEDAAQAAQALQPVAGPLASWIFALGIVGTGLLAAPVLSGSVAYALGQVAGWEVGFGRKLRQAKAFYAALGAVSCIGIGLTLIPVTPMRALFLSAVINGVIVVPILAATMIVASKASIMGNARAKGLLKAGGWIATAAMGLALLAQIAGWLLGSS